MPATRSQRGEVLVSQVVLLLVVLALAGAAAVLLIRTWVEAHDIISISERIGQNSRGINIATDSVGQLRRTNRLAARILRSVGPLDQDLVAVVRLARDVDGLAAAIDGTAGAVNGRVEAIGGTVRRIDRIAAAVDRLAQGINGGAGTILTVARLVDGDAASISGGLGRTVSIAAATKADTGDILRQAQAIHQTASCIDRRVGAAGGVDGHCTGAPGAGG